MAPEFIAFFFFFWRPRPLLLLQNLLQAPKAQETISPGTIFGQKRMIYFAAPVWRIGDGPGFFRVGYLRSGFKMAVLYPLISHIVAPWCSIAP